MSTYNTIATEARKEILGMIHRAQTSHAASNLSVIDIATVLYENLKEGDEVVWSAGWKAATIYYFLAKQGKIPKEDLLKFPNAPYLGLAETTVPGIHVNGGSVGHGLNVATGMALGKKLAREKGNIYCIMSDGELNEGSTWEAAMFAAHHKLDNLIVIVDKNGWQAMGKTEDVMDINAEDVFSGFGWSGMTVDGHDFDDIYGMFGLRTSTPRAVICKTVKGKGVSFMENHLLFHYKHITADEYQRALAELNA